jgi:hypothetical protein
VTENLITPQAPAPSRVRQVAVPPAVRALSTLSHVDYADAFLVDVGPTRERTAEQWSRAVMEDAPITVRRTLQSGWTGIGLKLAGKPSDRFVLGWEIRRNVPELVLLGADSRIGMSGELLFKREQDTLLFATFVQHDNHAARALWAGVEPVHVPVVRRVLEHASRRCNP